jgi:hypothetical protein
MDPLMGRVASDRKSEIPLASQCFLTQWKDLLNSDFEVTLSTYYMILTVSPNTKKYHQTHNSIDKHTTVTSNTQQYHQTHNSIAKHTTVTSNTQQYHQTHNTKHTTVSLNTQQ